MAGDVGVQGLNDIVLVEGNLENSDYDDIGCNACDEEKCDLDPDDVGADLPKDAYDVRASFNKGVGGGE